MHNSRHPDAENWHELSQVNIRVSKVGCCLHCTCYIFGPLQRKRKRISMGQTHSFESVAKKRKIEVSTSPAKNVEEVLTNCFIGSVPEDNLTDLKKQKQEFEASAEHYAENSFVPPFQQLYSFSNNCRANSVSAATKVSFRSETHEDLNINCSNCVSEECVMPTTTGNYNTELRTRNANADFGDDKLGAMKTLFKVNAEPVRNDAVDCQDERRCRIEFQCAKGFDVTDEKTVAFKARDSSQIIAEDGCMNDDSFSRGDDRPFVSLTANLLSEAPVDS